jgi:chitinase
MHCGHRCRPLFPRDPGAVSAIFPQARKPLCLRPGIRLQNLPVRKAPDGMLNGHLLYFNDVLILHIAKQLNLQAILIIVKMKFSVGTGCLPVLTLLLHSFAPLVLAISNAVEIDYWQRSRCPQSCSVVGTNPSSWSYYNDQYSLSICNNTTIFQLNLYNPVGDPSTHLLYRACTALTSTSNTVTSTSSTKQRRQFLSFNTTSPTDIQAPINIASWGTSTSSSEASSVSSAVNQLSDYLQQNSAISNSLFARSGNVVAGMYVGVEIDPSNIASLAQKFLDHAGSGPLQRQAAQICQKSNSTAQTQTFGVIFDTTGDLAAVQSAVQSWDNASCVTGSTSNDLLEVVSISLIPGTKIPIGPVGVHDAVAARSELVERATCSYLQVKSGNTCSTLATSCGITLAQFESYNGGASECSDLQIGQYVCCSAGSLPNFAPQPYANGTCYTYAIKSGDTCGAIATTYQMQVTVIEVRSQGNYYLFVTESNSKTDSEQQYLGVDGMYGSVYWHENLSKYWKPSISGKRSRKSSIEYTSIIKIQNYTDSRLHKNAVCGPQVNNTVYPASSASWAALNPCPINACCDIFGQCGITSDFCTASQAATGAPGTAAPGSNGCISNCGTEIVASSPPSTFARMGYFEAFNNQRCVQSSKEASPTKHLSRGILGR